MLSAPAVWHAAETLASLDVVVRGANDRMMTPEVMLVYPIKSVPSGKYEADLKK